MRSKDIVLAACDWFDVPRDLEEHSRTPHCLHMREIAGWMLREEKKLSYPQIAAAVGFRSHVSAIYSVRRVNESIALNGGVERYGRRVEDIADEIMAAGSG